MSSQEASVKMKVGRSYLLKNRIRREECINEMIWCQRDIDFLYEKQSEEQQKKSQQFEDLKKPHINRRTELIKTIPNFWINAIERHPKLCLLLDDEVSKVLRYMTKIETDDSNGESYKINFLFEENPYFENNRLTKELFLLKVQRQIEIRSSSTIIIWKPNQEGLPVHEETRSLVCNDGSSTRNKKNFFVWFCNNEKPYDDDNFSYFQAICETPLAYSPLFFDSSDEEIEGNKNKMGAGDHTSMVLNQVEDLNLNDSQND